MSRSTRFTFLLLFGVFTTAAQNYDPQGPFVFNVDYSRFRYDDSTGYLEMYYSFYPQVVSFASAQNSHMRGTVMLTIKIRQMSDSSVITHDRSYLPFLIADTSDESFRRTFISKTGYRLRHGEYMVTVTSADSSSPERSDSIALRIVVEKEQRGLLVSDIDLCSSIKSSTNKDDAFFRNSLEVIPNPSLVFGATTVPVMFSYAEVYNLDPSKTYISRIIITSVAGDTLKQVSKERKYNVANAVEANSIVVSSLPSGKNIFIQHIADSQGKILATSSKYFFTYNPHVQPSAASLTSAKSAELAGMSYEELGAEFSKARYIATEKDISAFNDLRTIEARREFLASFWVEVERGKLGKAPISRAEYLLRVETANKRFRVLSREGWQSDRGRVFILYGEPDEIERYPSQEETKPYETWHYYGIENGVVFVFVDRSGFSDYQLVHSTKRGELRDDTWERYLY